MSDALAEWKDVLRERDEEFRGLLEEHAAHDLRLDELRSRQYLTEEQKLEEVEIKKKKLLLKDRMAAIARRYRESARRG
jgi:uncharacterized protein YdcH (DUF465 family)